MNSCWEVSVNKNGKTSGIRVTVSERKYIIVLSSYVECTFCTFYMDRQHTSIFAFLFQICLMFPMPLIFLESYSIFEILCRKQFLSQILLFICVKILILKNFQDDNCFPWWQIGHSWSRSLGIYRFQ